MPLKGCCSKVEAMNEERIIERTEAEAAGPAAEGEKSDAEQIRRIERYEAILNEMESLLSDDALSSESLKEAEEKVREIEAYYQSPEWKRDYADDEAGKFPNGLRRGVLSEDGIFRMLEEYAERKSSYKTGGES